VLILSQKGDWPSCEQALKALERLAYEDAANAKPLAGVADNVSNTTCKDVQQCLQCIFSLVGNWKHAADVRRDGEQDSAHRQNARIGMRHQRQK
jgi:hypothetical protein